MKISEILNSGQVIDALEIAIQALPGGQDALDAAITQVQTETE